MLRPGSPLRAARGLGRPRQKDQGHMLVAFADDQNNSPAGERLNCYPPATPGNQSAARNCQLERLAAETGRHRAINVEGSDLQLASLLRRSTCAGKSDSMKSHAEHPGRRYHLGQKLIQQCFT